MVLQLTRSFGRSPSSMQCCSHRSGMCRDVLLDVSIIAQKMILIVEHKRIGYFGDVAGFVDLAKYPALDFLGDVFLKQRIVDG